MDSIQFQTAEFADNTPKCSACKAAIPDEFFQLAGQNICSNCAEIVRRHQELPSMAAFSRGLLYGAGAALLCFIGYAAFIMITGIEVGLIAIAVGYAVGMAVRKGSNGLGGRRCQIAAVALSYFAITFSYIPVGIREYLKQSPSQRAAVTEATKGKSITEKIVPTPGPAALLVGVVVLSGIALLTPFLNLTAGAGGILGLVILFFGLQRAWQVTKRDDRALTGPFRREEPAVA